MPDIAEGCTGTTTPTLGWCSTRKNTGTYHKSVPIVRIFKYYGCAIMDDDSRTEDAPAKCVPNENEGRKLSKCWEPEFQFNVITEWYCGECHKPVYYHCWRATYCPHCGAPIFNFPRRKLDAPQHRGMSYSDQEKMKYVGPERRPKHKLK